MNNSLGRSLLETHDGSDLQKMTIAVMWLVATGQPVSQKAVSRLMGKPNNWFAPSIDKTGERRKMLTNVQSGLQEQGVASPETQLQEQLKKANQDKAELRAQIKRLKDEAKKREQLTSAYVGQIWKGSRNAVLEQLETMKFDEQLRRQKEVNEPHLRVVPDLRTVSDDDDE